MPDVNEFLNTAIEETGNLNQGEVFLVRDLFKGYEWNRISRSERLLLGTLFLNYGNTSKTSIQVIEKTSSGQQQYRVKQQANNIQFSKIAIIAILRSWDNTKFDYKCKGKYVSACT